MTSPDTITLARGSHPAPPDDCGNPERCLFEAYNRAARHTHTDSRPPGVSPVLHRFGMRLNDLLPDEKRQRLAIYLPKPGVPSPLDGTAHDGRDVTRAYMAADWAVRTAAPAWLDLAGLSSHAADLRALPALTDKDSASTAYTACRGAENSAQEARRKSWALLRAADATAADAAADAAAADAAANADADASAAAAYDAAYDAAKNRQREKMAELSAAAEKKGGAS